MKRPERKGMVGWYDPPQLVQTAIEVVTSTLFGRHSDQRLVEALAAPGGVENDYRFDASGRPRKSMWIDYVADVGDGWDSTYTVAHYVAQPGLVLDGHATERGEILVLGGDQVYPTATRDEYAARFVYPYETAYPVRAQTTGKVDMYAIPGNHDWYDSLVAFTRLFCSKRNIGGYETKQARSYFALRLPHGYWILGTDVQLGSDIDGPQSDFFRDVAAKMTPTDRVILCNAEPDWVLQKMYERYDSVYDETNLRKLERDILKAKVRVFLAGDLHHYRRHTSEDGTHKITCGGGGAFLHPTHGVDVEELVERGESGEPGRKFALAKTYPSTEITRKLTRRNFAFFVHNPKFGLLSGGLYAILGWVLWGERGFGYTPMRESLPILLRNPSSLLLYVAVIVGFVLFTDTHSKVYRVIGGLLHAFSHLGAVLLLCLLASATSPASFGLSMRLGFALFILFAGGYLVGSTLLGIYHVVSLNLFGRHGNEAFGALKIPDYRCFLRLRIDEDGALTIFPIRIDRAIRKWRDRREDEHAVSDVLPDMTGKSAAQREAMTPDLIEAPIVLPAREGSFVFVDERAKEPSKFRLRRRAGAARGTRSRSAC